MTPRDHALLHVLSHRVRVLSIEQVSETWWRGALGSATSRLRLLRRQGYLELTRALVRPLPRPTEPIWKCNLGAPAPDMGALAYRLQSRWTEPLRPTIIVNATTRGAAIMGGYGGRRSRASELSHDLGLSAVYLLLFAKYPGRAKGWRSEASLYDEGFGQRNRLPDAMIVTRAEKTIIEFGGAYSKPKLQAFHASCVARQVGYEIW